MDILPEEKHVINPKQEIENIIKRLEKAEVTPKEGWEEIKKLKDIYLHNLTSHYNNIKNPEQSWHSFIGNKFEFEKVVKSIINAYFEQMKEKDGKFNSLRVLTDDEIKKKKNEVIYRKMAVRYGEYLLLPDIDLAIVDLNKEDLWKSSILAIISCKTSLRERIAQACYWKLKLLSSDITKNIRVFLVTADNDKDFNIDLAKKSRIQGKSRNRIISEFELDGIYILRDDFETEWESKKVKRYDRIFEDIITIFNNKEG